MARRKGMGQGMGKGYRNLLAKDKKVHADSAKGRKQPQRMPRLKDYMVRCPKCKHNVKNLEPCKNCGYDESNIRYCPRCGKRLTSSRLPQYAWECKSCDEDFLELETDKKPIKSLGGYANTMTRDEYEDKIAELSDDMKNCDACMALKAEGVTPACCQYHLDEQMNLYNEFHKDDVQEEEPEPDPSEMDDYDDDVPEEYHVTGECIQCGIGYGYSDMSPDYVKAGYCSRGCAEAGGYFGTRMKHGSDPDAKFDPKQLKRGIEVEMEHTDDPAIAKKIAKAHLAEFPDYYTRLDKMEEKAKKEIGVLDKKDKKYLGEERPFTENKYDAGNLLKKANPKGWKVSKRELSPMPEKVWEDKNDNLVWVTKSNYTGEWYFGGIDGRGYKKNVRFKTKQKALDYAEDYMNPKKKMSKKEKKAEKARTTQSGDDRANYVFEDELF